MVSLIYQNNYMIAHKCLINMRMIWLKWKKSFMLNNSYFALMFNQNDNKKEE